MKMAMTKKIKKKGKENTKWMERNKALCMESVTYLATDVLSSLVSSVEYILPPIVMFHQGYTISVRMKNDNSTFFYTMLFYV